MRYLKSIAFLGILLFAAGSALGQVSVGVGIGPGYVAYGPPPVCEWGYYDYAPYDCAPYGYYGPDYFVDGLFVGVGPWYHWGHPAWFWNRGYYGRAGWGHGYYAHPRFEGRGYDRGDARGYARENHGRGYARGNEGGFRGGQSFRGGESHGGGGFHGGEGFHGGGHR